MQRTRYSAIDVYTLEELWREYQASEPRGRIRLLKKLYRDDRRPPYEIAQMAVEDPHVEVRQWMARYGRSLDYREQGIRFLPDVHEAGPETESEGGSGKKCEIEWRFPERDLAARLKNDPDLFVRACLRENPEVFNAYSYEAWREYFLEATHLERLALLLAEMIAALADSAAHFKTRLGQETHANLPAPRADRCLAGCRADDLVGSFNAGRQTAGSVVLESNSQKLSRSRNSIPICWGPPIVRRRHATRACAWRPVSVRTTRSISSVLTGC